MKISFLCNSFLAMPSVQFLYSEQRLAGLATSSQNHMLSEQASQLAASMHIPFSVISRKNIEYDLKKWLELTTPDVVIVQTFPHLIPASCLDIPPLGFYNIHPSPLPSYRGPDPIFWQIANQESIGGVTLHKMEAQFDTGPVFHIEEIPIDINDTYGLVQSNLSFAAINAITEFLSSDDVECQLMQQSETAGSMQAKPRTDDLMIDWSLPAASIQALIRASNPHQNGAITFFRDVLTRILETNIITPEHIPKLPAGSIIAADDTRGLQILCADQLALEIKILHVEEGYFSGRRFSEIFDIKLGEKFCLPAFLSASQAQEQQSAAAAAHA